MVYTCNGILFNLKKENSDTTYHMDEFDDVMLVKISQSLKRKIWSESTYMSYLE